MLLSGTQGRIEKIQKEGAESPTLSLEPDCIIITTLEKRLQGLGCYKNVSKIQEKGGGRAPLKRLKRLES